MGRKTTKEYDAAGNLTSLTDAAKRTTTYTYSKENQPTKITYSDGKTHTVEYGYNADGLRTSMIDGTGTTTYTYDQLDRLTKTEDGHGDTVGYEYDLANEQTKITYPNGNTVTRTYDKAGRLASLTDWLEHTIKFAYNPDSALTATVFPSASSEEDTYAYNEADQQTATSILKGTETLASLAYTRDNNGQLTKTVATGLPGAKTTEYGYDENERLSKAGGSSYEYDAANNPTKLPSSTNSYDAASELEKGTGVTYTYNEMGQRAKTTPTAGPATTYGYDQAGNLISIERPAEGETPKIEDAYTYNADGLRASQTISGTTTYLTWDLSQRIPSILNDGTNNYIYGPGGLPVEQINGSGTVLYLHHDQAGSTRLITSSTGTVEGAYTYTPYGGTEGHTGTATTPLGYDAQYTSSDTGLIYLRARAYDPSTAQFISVDPIVPLTRTPYTYALDNPTNYHDPNGLFSIGEVLSGAGEYLEAGAQFVGQHYGQIAEAGALGVCLSGVGTALCLGATAVGFISSTVQNATSPSGFSPASEALDVLGTLPGAQIAGADMADLLGGGGGRTVAELFSTIVGGGAILGEGPIAEAEAAIFVC